jgi:hypothetical protein
MLACTENTQTQSVRRGLDIPETNDIWYDIC